MLHLLSLVTHLCVAHEIVGSNNPVAQLAAYEGKKTGCYMESLAELRIGCDDDHALSEDQRKQLALRFANCQFIDDGLPVKKSSAEMAAEAQAGNHLAYSIYTYHLQGVEQVCMYLSQRLFQKASLQASQELADASRRSAKELNILLGSVERVKDEATALRLSFAEHAVDVEENFKESHQHAAEMNDRIEAHRHSIERGLYTLENQIEDNGYKLNSLTDQADGISNKLLKVESSASSLVASQESAFMVMNNVEGIVQHLLGSVFSLESLAFFAVGFTFIYLVTTPVRSRGARFILLLLSLTNFMVERLMDRVIMHSDEERYAMVWMVRKGFTAVQVSTLLVVYVRWKDPQVMIQRHLVALESKLDALLTRRGASITRREAIDVSKDVNVRLQSMGLPATWTPCSRAAIGGGGHYPSLSRSGSSTRDQDDDASSHSTTYHSLCRSSVSRSFTVSPSPSRASQSYSSYRSASRCSQSASPSYDTE
eukprot:TRINITY_DN4933_c0_g1_i4.p1 TRINITY_DN4933_c0_g1~~TRINITY_DN4933_c0_g1_i4.p1  ORF type:complete len:483 (+),score=124.19 TRINITY_DN4933_c0_g1_i4:40-1488(+)